MNILGLVLGIGLSLGSVIAYIPQFHLIIKNRSVKGISEPTLLIMNIGLMCLTLNSLIVNWRYFVTNDLLKFIPFFQILISWIMVLIYYMIYITYKFRDREKRFMSGLYYIITYLLFGIFVFALTLGEKYNGDPNFFPIFAEVMGYTSAVANGIVWIPQIISLYRAKHTQNLSFGMFIMQTPGNLIIILFQAVIYKQPVSTWITYLFTLIEQTIILIMMIYYWRKNKNSIVVIVNEYDVSNDSYVGLIEE